MKFLHTADWQIGMKASRLGDAARRVREERISAATRVMNVAREHGVDFVLVAGDTFEDNAVDRVLVQKIADILGSIDVPVFIISGNHDPLVPGSVWEHPAWKSATNVRVLKDEAPVEIPQGTLFPCPVWEKHSARNPTAWIPSVGPGDKGFRIGLAHGTVEGIEQDEMDYPIPRDAAQRARLDYLALGHWHSYAVYQGTNSALSMAYSGTHETTRFGERDSGNVLVVEISAPGAPPRITPVKTGGLTWTMVEKDVREHGDLTAVRNEIESLPKPSNTLVAVKLSGFLMADEYAELEHLDQILTSRFLWGDIDISGLQPAPEDETWIVDLPPGIIREAAIRLRDNPGESPDIAARALMELYAIVRGMPV